MGNLNEENIRDWVRTGGKVFEIIKTMGNQVDNLGGNCSDLDRILKEPELCKDIAKVLMGASQITPIDPMEIIRTTGRSEDVREQAAELLTNDTDRWEVVMLAQSFEVAINALQGFEDKQLLKKLYLEVPRKVKYTWILSEDKTAIWGAILDTIDDKDLLDIYRERKDYYYYEVILGMQDESALKTVVALAKDLSDKKKAYGRIEDREYIQAELEKLTKIPEDDREDDWPELHKFLIFRLKCMRNPSSEES